MVYECGFQMRGFHRRLQVDCDFWYSGRLIMFSGFVFFDINEIDFLELSGAPGHPHKETHPPYCQGKKAGDRLLGGDFVPS